MTTTPTPKPRIWIDPVCGLEVVAHDFITEHISGTYHFCSEDCQTEFDDDPELHLEEEDYPDEDPDSDSDDD